MIEFNGYITGEAEKHFKKRCIIIGLNMVFVSLTMLSPAVFILAFKLANWLVVGVYCSLFIIIPALSIIPKGRREQIAITPKKIFVEGDSIVCVTDKFNVAKLIRDVKLVRDFGEFYDIVFPFGKVSEYFVCEKKLLTKGSLEQFESLFAGKIQRKTGDG